MLASELTHKDNSGGQRWLLDFWDGPVFARHCACYTCLPEGGLSKKGRSEGLQLPGGVLRAAMTCLGTGVHKGRKMGLLVSWAACEACSLSLKCCAKHAPRSSLESETRRK